MTREASRNAQVLTPTQRKNEELVRQTLISNSVINSRHNRWHPGRVCGDCVNFDFCARVTVKNVKVNTDHCENSVLGFKYK